MRLIFSCLLFLLLVGHAYASTGEQVEVTVGLLDDGGAHVTMVSANPPNFAELEGIINDPEVKSIYQERLSGVFGNVTDLRLYTQDRSMIIEFGFPLGDEKDGVWIINRTDFKDLVQPVSVLRIKLPEGTKMLKANPPPSKLHGKTLIWNDIGYIPNVEYAEESKGPQYKYGVILLPIILLFLVRILYR